MTYVIHMCCLRGKNRDLPVSVQPMNSQQGEHKAQEVGCLRALAMHTTQGSSCHGGVLRFQSGFPGQKAEACLCCDSFLLCQQNLPRGEKANSVLLESAVRGLEINVGEGGAEERVGVGME